MKKLAIIIIAVSLAISGCYREPYADFYASREVVEIGEVVLFTNISYNADYYEWDFGDGTMAFSYDARHAFTEPGFFTVTLFAFQDEYMVDRAYLTIEVLEPTELEITVLEYFDEYPVENASVLLYGSLDDWIDEWDPIVEGFTDHFGRTFFTGLFPKRYYVDVWEDFHNNYQLADEDIGFIETDRLIPNTVNYFIAWVDYTGPAKKSGYRDRSHKVIKLEQMDKRSYEEKLEKLKIVVEERKNGTKIEQ